jgi:hypothetical protein
MYNDLTNRFVQEASLNPVDHVEAPRGVNTYTITIKTLDRGYVVSVGCKDFSFTSRHEMMVMINVYLSDPQGIEKLFYENKLFANKEK